VCGILEEGTLSASREEGTTRPWIGADQRIGINIETNANLYIVRKATY
jgi:hypothetical protein